jgi:hypothetical protein
MTEPENPKPKNMAHFDFPPGAGPAEIAKAIQEARATLLAEKAKGEVERTEDTSDDPPISMIASVWETTTQSLSDAAIAISDAGAAFADRAADIRAASVEVTTDTAKHIVQASVNAFSGVGLTSAIEYLDDAIDQQAIKSAIVDAAEAVGDKLDQVTGKQLVEMLEAKLRRQDEYNDILATRLAEALQRIATIEQRLGK